MFSFRFLNFSFICSHESWPFGSHVFSTIVCLPRFTSIHFLICWVSWFVFLRGRHQTNNCSFPSSFIAKKNVSGSNENKNYSLFKISTLCFFSLKNDLKFLWEGNCFGSLILHVIHWISNYLLPSLWLPIPPSL